MGNENGVDTAKRLHSFDFDCLLVFTTTSTDYVYDFRDWALHYLVKPYKDAAPAALFDSIDFILKNGKRISVSRDLAKAARLAFGDFLFARRT